MLKTLTSRVLRKVLETKSGQNMFFRFGNALYALPTFDHLPRNRDQHQRQFWQGFFNYRVVSEHMHRLWPSWVYRQFYPLGASYVVPSLHRSLMNVSFRNWVCLNTAYDHVNSVVDPSGLLVPASHGLSVDYLLGINDRLVSPCRQGEVTQSLSCGGTVVKSVFSVEGVQVVSELFSRSYLKQTRVVLNSVTLKNMTDQPVSFSFFFAIRPYNIEGISPVSSIHYVTEQAFVADNRLALVLDQRPDNIICSCFDDGDFQDFFQKWQMILGVQCPRAMASAYAEYKVTLAPQAERKLTAKIPVNMRVPTFPKKARFQFKKPGILFRKTIRFYRGLSFEQELDQAKEKQDELRALLCEISVPDQRMKDVFQDSQSHVQALFMSDTVLLSLLKRQLDTFLLTCSSMVLAGGHQVFQQFVSRHFGTFEQFFLKLEIKTGYALGLFVQLVFRVYRLQPDQAFLEQCFGFLYPCVRSFDRQRRVICRVDVHRGLLPARAQKEYSPSKEYYLWDNLGFLSAADELHQMAGLLGYQIKQPYLRTVSHDVSVAIDRVCAHVSEYLVQQPVFPVSPKTVQDPRLLLSLVGVFPFGIVERKDARIAHTLSLLERHFMVQGIYFSQMGPLGCGSYQNLLLAHVYLSLGDKRFFSILDWLMKSVSEVGTWPEALHPGDHGGCYGDGHYLPSNGLYQMLMQRMLVDVFDDHLHVFPMIPSSWCFDGARISVKRFPTHYGVFEVTAIVSKKEVSLRFRSTFHKMPTHIKLSWPSIITRVESQGSECTHSEHEVMLPGDVTDVLISFA